MFEVVDTPDNQAAWERAMGRSPIVQLPTEYGLPTIEDVKADNGHGTQWVYVEGGDQGPYAQDIDRYYARYESAEGYRADYFYIEGSWSLGAN